MSKAELTTKRGLDVGVSSLVILILAPVFILIAILIRLESKGPALFRQKRLGKLGEGFECYKFRTMYIDAADLRNEDGSTFNSQDDPRVTRVGSFLRKSSLDELPQFVNVLRGDMSLVGPRPDQLDQLRYYTPHEMLRLTVKPGITGLAQVNGRNSISWDQRKQLDLEYVRRQSLRLDLRVLIQTIPHVLVRKDVFIRQSQDEANRRVSG